jgi:hypothetical protein
MFTTHTQKAIFQSPALQVGVELLLDVIRQGATRHGAHLAECWIVLRDKLIQQGLLGLMQRMAWSASK